MSERNDQGSRHRRPGRASAGRARLWLSPAAVAVELLAVLAVAVVLLALLLQGRALPLPEALAERLAARASLALGREVGLTGLEVVVGRAGQATLRAQAVTLAGAGSAPDLRVALIEAQLAPGALIGPARAPERLRIVGAEVALRRGADGTLAFGPAADPGANPGAGPDVPDRSAPAIPAAGAAPVLSAPQAADALRDLLARPALAPLREVAVEGLTLDYADLRSGRAWSVTDGRLTVTRGAGEIAIALSAQVPGRVALRVTLPESGPGGARLSALVDGVPAADIAAQADALAFLAPLEADVSGALIGTLDARGRLGPIDGTLEIGAGRVTLRRETPGRAGLRFGFDSARAYFAWRPAAGRLRFDALSVEAPGLSVAATGQVLASAAAPWGAAGAPVTLQLQLERAEIDRPALLAAPLRLDGGTLEARLTGGAVGTPTRAVEIGQLTLLRDGAEPVRLSARGRVAVEPGGIAADLDLGLADLSPRALLGLWPPSLVSRSRDWLDRNLLEGQLRDAHAGLRLRPGARPKVGLTFAVERGKVRALRGMPPILAAEGHGQVIDDSFALTLVSGRAEPPQGGALDMSGLVFRIPDTRLRPPDGELRWRSSGNVTAALSLLDQPPLRLMARTGRPVALAEGRARIAGTIRFPMRRGVTPDQIRYDLAGEIADLRSEVLVPGRLVEAEALRLTATKAGLELAGAAELDGVPFNGRYRQPFGVDAPPAGISGRLTLSPALARAFPLGLPPDALSGAARADLDMTLPRGAAPELRLESDLSGLGLRIDALDWRKPEAASGRLALAGRLGSADGPGRFETVALSAPGFDVVGALALAPGGGLARLSLERARIGDWFDGRVSLRGRGAGAPPGLELSGGRLDLRRAGLDPPGGGSGNGLGPVTGRLDRVVLADGIALTDVAVDLDPAGGLSGALGGRVNGRAEVTGRIAPGRGGRPRLQVGAPDAGAVLAAAGAFDEARGGVLELTLSPAAGARAWDGRLSVTEMRVTAAPGLAALLNAISVVGLIDQLNGPGLLFSRIEAGFRLTPGRLTLTEGSAVGPSLGVSADGVFDLARGEVDIGGVLSPFYAVNSIGQVFTRAGEGLFGVTYRVTGPASAPQVSVNPLSLLTPGAFREIFRAAPPPANGGGDGD